MSLLMGIILALVSFMFGFVLGVLATVNQIGKGII